MSTGIPAGSISSPAAFPGFAGHLTMGHRIGQSRSDVWSELLMFVPTVFDPCATRIRAIFRHAGGCDTLAESASLGQIGWPSSDLS